MSALAKKKLYSIQEYLDLELKTKFKSEFHHGEIFAMLGAKFSHNIISSNLNGEIRNFLKSNKCYPLNSDQKISIQNGERFVYPDVSVVCDHIDFLD